MSTSELRCLLGAALAVGALVISGCSQQSEEPGPPEPAVDVGRPVLLAKLADVADTPRERSSQRLQLERERQVIATVKSWVAAWSEQRTEEYLGHYSPAFMPEGGIDRELWEAQRRERLAARRFIRVTTSSVQIEWVGSERARARFLQHYRSEAYTDTVRKTLELEWRDGRWRIQRERSERVE